MDKILKIEWLGLVIFSLYLFLSLGYQWWLYPLLILLPDLGMLGYAFGPKWGAYTYNLTHHLGVAVLLFLIGIALQVPLLVLTGTIMLGHSASDRMLGFGLKYTDSFQHTHLGMIGKSK
jgi:hypothetical protein